MKNDMVSLLRKLEEISKTKEMSVLKESAGLSSKKRFVNEADEVKVKILSEHVFNRVEKKFGKNSIKENYEKILWKLALTMDVSPRKINEVIMEDDSLRRRIDKIRARAAAEREMQALAGLVKPEDLEKVEKTHSYDEDLGKLRDAAERWVEARNWNPKYDKINLLNDISSETGIDKVELRKYLEDTGLWDYKPNLLR